MAVSDHSLIKRTTTIANTIIYNRNGARYLVVVPSPRKIIALVSCAAFQNPLKISPPTSTASLLVPRRTCVLAGPHEIGVPEAVMTPLG